MNIETREVQIFKQELLVRENFLANYKTYLKRYIADGSAREDTLITYYSHISQYLEWCLTEGLQPLNVDKNILIEYRNYLVSLKLEIPTIALKLSALRRFYEIALSRKIIPENPVLGVKAPKQRKAANIEGAKYISVEQLENLFHIIPEHSEIAKEQEEFLRAKSLIALMGLQGLRTVETHRLSCEDIDFSKGLVLVKGKGRDRYIAPREDVLNLLKTYLDLRQLSCDAKDTLGTPVFTSLSNNNTGKRLSRCAIRDVIDYWFICAGIKEKGDHSGRSCHLLRHTTGALLYQATHDLIVVQKELGHVDPKTTSKYAHIQDILSKRYTQNIPIKTL